MAPGAIDPTTATSLAGMMGSSATTAAQPTDGSAFGSALTGAVDNLQQLQGTSNALAIQAVTGDLNDIHTATIAGTRAQVTMELVAAIRNKGVDAGTTVRQLGCTHQDRLRDRPFDAGATCEWLPAARDGANSCGVLRSRER